MDSGEHVIPTGAIYTAMQTIEAMHGRVEGSPEQVAADLMESIDEWGVPTLLEAYSMIIYSGMQLAKPSDPERDGDRVQLVVPAVVTKMRRLELDELDDRDIATVAGLLTAAALEQGPYEWRTALGPVPRSEGMLWAYTAWLLSDFVDATVFDQPGRFAEILTAVLMGDPDGESTN